jgi:hypothetical protein
MMGLALAAAGCDAGNAYYYFGHQYEPSRDCLDSVAELDILTGDDPGSSCASKCIKGTNGDGGVIVYATSMCGPPPVAADITGTNPLCSFALAAVGRGDYCLDGGGSTNPLEDSGADVDAGTD